MRLIVLDTNVLVSAGIKREGFPARIVERVIREADLQVAVSPSIVAEYWRIFRYLKSVQYRFPPLWLEFLIEGALRFPDGAAWPLPLPDAEDGCFLSLAKATGAWLIAGDVKHYPEESRAGVVVCGTSDYVAILALSV